MPLLHLSSASGALQADTLPYCLGAHCATKVQDSRFKARCSTSITPSNFESCGRCPTCRRSVFCSAASRINRLAYGLAALDLKRLAASVLGTGQMTMTKHEPVYELLASGLQARVPQQIHSPLRLGDHQAGQRSASPRWLTGNNYSTGEMRVIVPHHVHKSIFFVDC